MIHYVANDPQRFHPDRFQCSGCPFSVSIRLYGIREARRLAYAHVGNPNASVAELLLADGTGDLGDTEPEACSACEELGSQLAAARAQVRELECALEAKGAA